MSLPEIKEILKLLATNSCPQELEFRFLEWLDQASKEDHLEVLTTWEMILEGQSNGHTSHSDLILKIEDGLNKLDAPVSFPKRNKKIFPIRPKLFLGVAASLLILLTSGLFLYNYKNKKQFTQNTLAKDILPGGNKAILILSDGTKVNLNGHQNGEITRQAGIKIEKNADGQLAYTVIDKSGVQDKALFNTIQTPVGGQYRISLPDGSVVWLNAASSLRYQVAFNSSNERSVELQGEGYFEVAKDKTRPFRVVTQKQTVEVLGTHFNINSYEEEQSTKTTLLEGSVKVEAKENKRIVVLAPGQQSQVDDHNLTVKDVDVNDSAAWKDGFFVFNDESIPAVMRTISRWYGVEVQYQGKISDKDLAGSISKFNNVSEILKMLELTGLVRFKVEGRKITVIAN